MIVRERYSLGTEKRGWAAQRSVPILIAGARRRPHDDRSAADAEKALVPSRCSAAVRNAWAAIEGQGERVTENEQGGRRACVVVLDVS